MEDKEKENMDKNNVNDFSRFENKKVIIKTKFGSIYTAIVESVSGTQISFTDKYNEPIMLDTSVIASIVSISGAVYGNQFR